MDQPAASRLLLRQCARRTGLLNRHLRDPLVDRCVNQLEQNGYGLSAVQVKAGSDLIGSVRLAQRAIHYPSCALSDQQNRLATASGHQEPQHPAWLWRQPPTQPLGLAIRQQVDEPGPLVAKRDAEALKGLLPRAGHGGV